MYATTHEAIKHCAESCPSDVFENAIRTFGVVAACEWFGYPSDSEFTAETIKVLKERSDLEK